MLKGLKYAYVEIHTLISSDRNKVQFTIKYFNSHINDFVLSCHMHFIKVCYIMSKKVKIDALDNWETYEKELPFKRIRNCGNIDPSQYGKLLFRDMVAPQPPKEYSLVLSRKESQSNQKIVGNNNTTIGKAYNNSVIDLTSNNADNKR